MSLASRKCLSINLGYLTGKTAIGNHSHHHRHYHHWSKLRNYVRNNALCRAGTEFGAETCKIRRDAANKLYVEQSVKILKDRQGEIYERLIAFEKDMQTLQTAVKELRHMNHIAE